MVVVAAIAGVVLLIIAVSVFMYIRRRGGKKPGQRGGFDTVSVGSRSVGSMSVGSMSVGSVGSAASGLGMGSRSAINTGRPF